MTTNAAAATAMFAWLWMDHVRGHKIRVTGACVGAIIGMVAITPAAGRLLSCSAAGCTGLLGGAVGSCNA